LVIISAFLGFLFLLRGSNRSGRPLGHQRIDPVGSKVAHDAKLVAAMVRHQVTHLLTFNVDDFARFAEITAITPDAVVTGSLSL
jgi:hypothetical protein